MKGDEATEILGDLASRQWGLFTSAQAKVNGVDLPSLRRLEKRGAFSRIRHGVYASTATALTAELEIKAQWLSLQPELMAEERVSDPSLSAEAVVSHTTAAAMWEIGDLWPDGIHFTVKRRRRSRQADVRFHRADLADSDWVIHPTSGLPTTTVVRTIFDLAQAGNEPGHLLDVIADAGRRSLLNEEEFLNYFSGHEESFGLNQGDRLGLKELVDEYFIGGTEERKTRLLVDEAIRPLQEQIRAILSSISPSLSWSTTITPPPQNNLEQLSLPMQSVIEASKLAGFSELTESVKEMTKFSTIPVNPWVWPYPQYGNPFSRSISRPLIAREGTDINEQSFEGEEDAWSNHCSFEEGSKNPGKENK